MEGWNLLSNVLIPFPRILFYLKENTNTTCNKKTWISSEIQSPRSFITKQNPIELIARRVSVKVVALSVIAFLRFSALSSWNRSVRPRHHRPSAASLATLKRTGTHAVRMLKRKNLFGFVERLASPVIALERKTETARRPRLYMIYPCKMTLKISRGATKTGVYSSGAHNRGKPLYAKLFPTLFLSKTHVLTQRYSHVAHLCLSSLCPIGNAHPRTILFLSDFPRCYISEDHGIFLG